MKVLIVDDSYLLRTRLQKALTEVHSELRIKMAGNCSEALEVFRPFSPDTVILDIALPDGSGIELLKNFRREKPDVKVIVFTNYPKAEFKKNCLALGADQFLDKSNIGTLLNYFK
jgi:two-component system, NarL family, invasion response regulator UvrY